MAKSKKRNRKLTNNQQLIVSVVILVLLILMIQKNSILSLFENESIQVSDEQQIQVKDDAAAEVVTPKEELSYDLTKETLEWLDGLGFEMKVGDKFGDLTVESIQQVMPSYDYIIDNVKIDFSGETEITGEYKVTRDSEGPGVVGFWDGTVNINLDEDSVDKLPGGVMGGYTSLFLSETDELVKYGDTGVATIVITNLEYTTYPGGSPGAGAKVVKVIKVESK